MTILERVKSIVKSAEIDFSGDSPASIEKMIYAAYYIGREESARRVSNMYNEHIAEQRKRAQACRYHRLAESIVGEERYLYSPDYSGDVTDMLCNDPADI